MSHTNGTISDSIDNDGKSVANTTPVFDSGTQGRVDEPEILRGIDTESPDRIKIDFGGSGGGNSGSGPKRRGRPPGSGRKSATEATAQESLHLASFDLKDILISLHAMGASFFQVAELNLSEIEAQSLADAIAKVAKYHAVNLDPCKFAYINLAMVAGSIYGSRFVEIKRRNATKPRPAPVPINKTETPSEPVFDPQTFHMESMSNVGSL